MTLCVNQIQTFSLHDGPGIRSTVFLQGCNLRCAWCHNPETWSMHTGVSYTEQKCIGCGACVAVCPKNAHEFVNGSHVFHPERCENCRRCLEVCFAQAMEASGKEMELEAVLEQLLRDRNLYRFSDGGVTFSGGEPLLQHQAVAELLKKLKEQHIHTAIESALNVPWDWVEECLPWLDLMMADFKVYDAKRHQTYTHADNAVIMQNLRNLADRIPLCIRIPVVGGINDNADNMERSAQFLSSLKAKQLSVELLAYHDFGIAKAQKVGLVQRRFSVPKPEDLNIFAEIFRQYGLMVQAG